MKIKKITVLCLLAANCLMVSAQKWFTPDVEKQVNILLSQMTVEEKLAYIGGVDWMYTKNIDRLGIHRMKMTDGPQGSRQYYPRSPHPVKCDAHPRSECLHRDSTEFLRFTHHRAHRVSQSFYTSNDQ